MTRIYEPHHVLGNNPDYWRGRAKTRRHFADNPSAGEDPQHHDTAAAEYEARAKELTTQDTP